MGVLGPEEFPWLYDEEGHLIEEQVLREMTDLVHYVGSLNIITQAVTDGSSFVDCDYDPYKVLALHDQLLADLLQQAEAERNSDASSD